MTTNKKNQVVNPVIRGHWIGWALNQRSQRDDLIEVYQIIWDIDKVDSENLFPLMRESKREDRYKEEV